MNASVESRKPPWSPGRDRFSVAIALRGRSGAEAVSEGYCPPPQASGSSGGASADTSADDSIFRRYAELVKRQWRLFAVIGACMLVLSLLQLPGPVLSMKVIDAVNGDAPPSAPLIHWMCAALLLTVLAGRAVHVVQRWALEKFRYRLTFSIQRSLLGHVLRLPMSYHLRHSHGYMMSRVNEDPTRLQGLMASTVLSVLGDFLTLIVGVSFLFYVHWRLALLAVLVLPPLLVMFIRLRTSLKEDFKESQERSALVNRYLAESLANVFTIKVFSLEGLTRKKYVRVMADAVRKRFQILRKRLVYENVIALLTGVVPVGILWIGAFEIVHGRLSVGEFIAFSGFLAYLYRPAEGIVIALLSMQSSISAVERVFEIFDTEPEADAARAASAATRGRPAPGVAAVELRDVGFRYSREGDWVLRRVTLAVARGEFVAVMGPSGMGKTTLLGMVPRLVEPVEGELLIHGLDHSLYPLRHLRRLVTMVSLETKLFASSVADNVRCGLRRATFEQVVEASRLACADEFVRGLPRGYDTELGETGLNISAGQRQRLLIARALLRQPSILILDEATSFLNPELEERVLKNVRRAMRGRTVICVSHRPSILGFADRKFVVEHGRVVEDESLDSSYPKRLLRKEVA